MGLTRTLTLDSTIEALSLPRSTRLKSVEKYGLKFSRVDKYILRPMKVQNLSPSGLALSREEFVFSPKVGEKLEGRLELDGITLSCGLLVRHVTEGVVGCQYVGPDSDRIRHQLEEYFAVELLALRLRFAEERQAEQINGCWLHCLSDGYQSEVAYNFTDGRVEYFHLAFLGMYVEGGDGQPLKFGCVVKNPVREEIRGHIFGAKETNPNETIGVIRLARRLISKMAQVPPEVRQALLLELGGG